VPPSFPGFVLVLAPSLARDAREYRNPTHD